MSWMAMGEDKYADWGVSSFDAHQEPSLPKAEDKAVGLARLREEWLADEAIAAALPQTLHVRYSAELAWNGEPCFVVVNPTTKECVAFMRATEDDLRFGSGEADLPAIISRRMSAEPTSENIHLHNWMWEAPTTRRRNEPGGPPRLDEWEMALRLLTSLRQS